MPNAQNLLQRFIFTVGTPLVCIMLFPHLHLLQSLHLVLLPSPLRLQSILEFAPPPVPPPCAPPLTAPLAVYPRLSSSGLPLGPPSFFPFRISPPWVPSLFLFSLRPFFLNFSSKCPSSLICFFVFKPRDFTASRVFKISLFDVRLMLRAQLEVFPWFSPLKEF